MGSTTLLVLVERERGRDQRAGGGRTGVGRVVEAVGETPRLAVLLCAVLNVAGAFLSLKVATTIAKGIVESSRITLSIVSAALLGVITLALVAHGSLPKTGFSVPTWVILSAAFAMGIGTYSGGWRIIRTLGHRLTNVQPPQGFSAESSAGAVILASSYFGYPLSTTHVVGGAVLGSGVAATPTSGGRWQGGSSSPGS